MTPEESATYIVASFGLHPPHGLEARITGAIRQAVADEREACAKVGDSYSCGDWDYAAEIAKAIRARGKE
jgi:hypothetical protein